MQIRTAVSRLARSDDAVKDCLDQLTAALDGPLHLVLGLVTEFRDPEELRTTLLGQCRGTPFLVHTSCRGAMTETGFHAGPTVMALLGISDATGEYAVASGDKAGDPGAATEEILDRALARTSLPFRQPGLIWLAAAPGGEEQVLSALERVLGERVPVVGGSSADESVSGNWFQVTQDGVTRDGIALAVMHPSTEAWVHFRSGYTPGEHVGVVTRAEGRTLREISGEPAAVVYDRWTQGAIQHAREGGVVLMDTTLYPLGRVANRLKGLDLYVLSHPESVLPDGSIRLFTDIEVGEPVVCMAGTPDSIVGRAEKVVAATASEPIEGALVTYCAGCMLTVEDRMHEVATLVRRGLGRRPFLGQFTFGEQGRIGASGNRHGNLMISSVAFGQES